MPYNIYVALNEKPSTLTGLTPVASVQNPPQTVSYTWLPNQIYWIGVSAVSVFGIESTPANWFRIYTGNNGAAFKPLARPYNVYAVPVASGQLTVSFNVDLTSEVQEPYYYDVATFDGATKLTTLYLGTRVAGQTSYQYTFTPSVTSGVLRISPITQGGMRSGLFNSIAVPFCVDGSAPTNTVFATIGT